MPESLTPQVTLWIPGLLERRIEAAEVTRDAPSSPLGVPRPGRPAARHGRSARGRDRSLRRRPAALPPLRAARLRRWPALAARPLPPRPGGERHRRLAPAPAGSAAGAVRGTRALAGHRPDAAEAGSRERVGVLRDGAPRARR